MHPEGIGYVPGDPLIEFASGLREKIWQGGEQQQVAILPNTFSGAGAGFCQLRSVCGTAT